MTVAACILSFHMPDLTSKTVSDLQVSGWELGKNLFVFENQDPHEATDYAESVTHFTGSNLRMTGGWNFIADWCGSKYERVWFCTNDFEVLSGHPSPNVLSLLPDNVGWWHPSLEPIEKYCFPWMFTTNPAGYRDVPMTDSICPAITRRCMDHLRTFNQGKVFDPAFFRGWGIDYDSCWQIRSVLKDRVVIHDAVRIRHKASRTYTSGTAPEDMQTFYDKAHGEMSARLTEKYGPQWYQMMMRQA
jgi:hypothetical protein